MPINYAELENSVSKRWQDQEILNQLLVRDAKRLTDDHSPKYIFWEGPPTANGAPGLHHLLARTYKDAVLRFWSLKGYAIPRQAGWDCHGLPVELQVEKELGISGKKEIEKLKETPEKSIAYFNEQCQKSVFQFLEKWEEVTERLGYWIDKEHAYRTLDNSYIESVWWVLFRAWAAGFLEAKKKVVPHCPRCVSTLSSHELAQGYQEKTPDPSVFVKFKITSGGRFKDVNMIVWTTTPWTLPANVAVATKGEINYFMGEIEASDCPIFKKGEKYIFSQGAERTIFEDTISYGPPPHENDWNWANINFRGRGNVLFKNVDPITGYDLEGLEYEPLYSKGGTYKVVLANFVSDEDGTGLVHIAPAYGEEDNILGEKLGLPVIESVDLNGIILEGLPGAGKFFKDGDNDILDDLKKRKLILNEASEQIKHTYPFCWRCGTPLIYVAKDSWFIKVSDPKIKDLMIEKNQKIHWEPEHIKDGRFGEWLVGARDWAISRERYWGTPLPLWQNKNGELRFFNLSQTEIASAENINELFQKGLDWVQTELKKTGQEKLDYHRPSIDQVKFDDFSRLNFVCDVWLDSGCMPYAQSGYKGWGEVSYPANFIAEAMDQTRGWFYTLLAVACILEASGVALPEKESPPFKNVICLGLINDARGQKMSKSKGNVIEPLAEMEKYGADTMRLALVSINPAGEAKNFDEKFLETTQRNTLNLLFNMMQFYEQYAGLTTAATASAEVTDVMDKWVKAFGAKKYAEWHNYFENNKLTEASRAVIDYVTEASTWYVRLSRGRFKGAGAAAALFSLREVLKTAALMLAPLTPHLSDFVWQKVGAGELFLNDQPQLFAPVEIAVDDNQILTDMAVARQVIEAGRKVREANGLKVRQPLTALKLDKITLAPEYLDIIKNELNVLEVKNGTDKWPSETVVGGQIFLDINLTSELKKMGFARELKRVLSDWRKQQKLKVGEAVSVSLWTESVEINQAVGEVMTELSQEIWLEAVMKENDGEILKIDGAKIKILKS